MSFSLLCVIEYHFYNNKKQSRYNHEQCGGLQISIEHNNTLPLTYGAPFGYIKSLLIHTIQFHNQAYHIYKIRQNRFKSVRCRTQINQSNYIKTK